MGAPFGMADRGSSTLVLVLKTKNPAFAGFFVLELGPGSLEGQPVLLSLGVGRTLREERCTEGA